MQCAQTELLMSSSEEMFSFVGFDHTMQAKVCVALKSQNFKQLTKPCRDVILEYDQVRNVSAFGLA